jgi:hypothetical protein
MAVAHARDLSETRSVPGLQYHFVQLWRRVEGVPSEGVAAKHIIAMKFSTEAIVALAVAVVFVLLTFGAFAREQGQRPAHSGHNAHIAAASNVNLSQVVASETDILGVY